MILAVDCGNTHTTFGCVDADNNVKAVFRIPTDPHDTEFGYAAKIRQILKLENVDFNEITGAVMSCVVPPVTDILVNAVRLLFGLDTLIVGAGVKTGLHICTNDPGTVASDLVSTAVAAKENYPLPCIIVDMGTATTLTVVDRNARFTGGAILPGVGISMDALADHTALLPHIEIKVPDKAIASTTVECMKSGIVYGMAGAIDAIIARFESEMGEKAASVVATGSVSPLICPNCAHSITIDETLILKGLGIIWFRNRGVCPKERQNNR